MKGAVLLATRLAALLPCLLGVSAQAAELTVVSAERSQISFVSKQMGVPVDGSFRKFEAQVSVDPARPESAKARFDVDIASIDCGSDEANTEVKGKNWFNVLTFPKASFVTTQIKAVGGNRYEARGPLSIKGISRDTLVPFTIRPEAGGAWFEGAFVLPRLQFKIGQGAWSDPDTVADEVQVKFKLFVRGKK
jgi:polyisoprenoid-binding protein YceI